MRRGLSPKFIETAILGVVAFALSGALVRVLSSGTDDLVATGDRRFEVALALFYLAVALIFFAHSALCTRAVLGTPALPALLALTFLSALWAEMPTLVLRRSIGVIGATLFGVTLASRLTFDEQLVLLRRIVRLCAFLCLGAWLVGHALGIELVRGGILPGETGGPWRGIFNHKNMLGSAVALGVLLEWHLPSSSAFSRVAKFTWICVYAVLLVLSNSMTSVVALAITFAIMFAVKSFRGRYALVMPAAVVAILLCAILIFTYADSVTAAMGRSSDLTGRADLWHWTTIMIRQRPFLGYGFSGFWRGASQESVTLEARILWSPIYAHNGYLEILLSLGAAGLGLFALMAASGLRRTLRIASRAQSIQDLWPLAFIIFFLLHNMGEVSILWQNNLEWGLFVATVIGADPRLRAALEPEDDDLSTEAVPTVAEYA